jgi:hypothetical protein
MLKEWTDRPAARDMPNLRPQMGRSVHAEQNVVGLRHSIRHASAGEAGQPRPRRLYATADIHIPTTLVVQFTHCNIDPRCLCVEADTSWKSSLAQA